MTVRQILSMTDDQMKDLDIIILADRSTSMGEPSHRFEGKTRWQELQEQVEGTARIAEQFDTDGITVIDFSKDANVQDGVTSRVVHQIFTEKQPNGSTNLAKAYEKAIEKAKASTKKSVVVLAYTDGVPDSTTDVEKVLARAGKELGRPKFGTTIIQVGKEKDATKFLHHVDTEMNVDVAATITAEDAEDRTVQELCWMALNS